jgi:antitoxin component YwqK of YwqJK toxin-antitoxin module
MELEIRTEYHLNSKLDYELSYLNGRAHGVQKEYYENGQICCQYYIENGLVHGPEIKFKY